MKSSATSNPKAGPNDPDKMRDAIEALNAEGVRFSRPTQYQLKVGDINFYPGTGRIFRDGEDKAWEQQGLSALISYLREKRSPTGKIIEFASAVQTIPPQAIDLSDIAVGDDPNHNFSNRVINLVPSNRRPH